MVNSFLWLALIVSFIVFIQKNARFSKNLFEKLNIPNGSVSNLFYKIVFIVSFVFIVHVLVFTPDWGINNKIAGFIMKSSGSVLSFLGYQVHSIGRYVYGSAGRIWMNDPCIGINLALTFLAYIILLGRHVATITKFAFIGVSGILLLNITRISLLYIYLVKTNGDIRSAERFHDWFNWAVYLLIILLLVFYVKKNRKMNIKTISHTEPSSSNTNIVIVQ
jgi:exosortase/archaeosortase family protein